ncbi:MAG: family 20 glycosylhydrolase [Defluviitaleaceae bacterium]|nr:family 20 glycosylhydrolase [Defluviitaleaceae bacterium]
MTIYVQSQQDSQAAGLFIRLMGLWHNKKINVSQSSDADVVAIRDENLPNEGFRLVCDGKQVKVTGNGQRGIAYGLAELAKRYSTGFPQMNTTESPYKPFRGIHLYMPGKDDVEGFYRLIDMMVVLKMNSLIIEVGGGMEYKKHPEINKGWELFCKQVTNFPEGPRSFQGSDMYWKDSTHTELGGGSYLPQTTVKGIVDYAKDFGLDVVPEVQYLSHAYYITTVYPQFAERVNDHHADAVCPKNEDAYQLYFELAEEIIEIFQPKEVSIGQDEIRIMGMCDICKDIPGHELFAYEINRLHEFYAKKGIQISMWCEKLQNVQSYYTGKFFGGTERNRVNKFGRQYHLPAMHEAVDLIPKDVILQDWLYGWTWDSQEYAVNRGFSQIYGNFHGEWMRHPKRRFDYDNVLGGEVSSWGRAHERILGRDGIIGDCWYSALVLWDKSHDENMYDEYHKQIYKELPMLRELLQNKQSAKTSLAPKDIDVFYVSTKGQNEINATDLPQVFSGVTGMIPGVPVGENETVVPLGKTADRLLFVHSTLGSSPFSSSCFFMKDELVPVIYGIRYADGQTLFQEARFGTEIGNVNMKTGRQVNYTGVTPEDPHGLEGILEDRLDPPLYIINDLWQNSLIYSATPFVSRDNTAYVMEWVNPRPDIAIERIFAVNIAKELDEQALLYCIAAVSE